MGNASAARILLLLLIPGHVIFVITICFLESLGIPSPLFFLFYLLAAVCQVAILLYLCQLLVYFMWSKGTDPDNAAIPYLTAIGDLSLIKLDDPHHIATNVTELLNFTISEVTGQ